MLRFTTHMVPAGGGEIAWTGFIVVDLDDDGRIRRDHQFTEPPSTTRSIVDEYLTRRAQDTPERVAALFAETVDWHVSWPEPHHPVVPWIRPRTTRQDIAGGFRTFGSACVPEEGEVRLDTTLINGNQAILIGTSSQLVKATGKRFTMTFALHLTVDNGLITRHHMYEDSLAVLEAFTD